MSDRAFLDTNVVVYLFDDDEPMKQGVARRLLDTSSATLVVSTQVLSEFFVTVTRKLARPLAPPAGRQAVATLAALPVIPTDTALVAAAVDTSIDHQISLWDALIIEAAAVSGCSRLYTEDLADGSTIRGVQIENPFAGS